MTPRDFSSPNPGQSPAGAGQKPPVAQVPTGHMSTRYIGELPPIVMAPVPANLLNGPADLYLVDDYAPNAAAPFAPQKTAEHGSSSKSALPVILALTAIFGGFVVLLGCGGLLMARLLVDRSDHGHSQFTVSPTRQQAVIRTPTYPDARPSYVAPPPTPYTPPTFRAPPPMGGDVSDSLRESQRVFDELRIEQQQMFDEQRKQMEQQIEQQMEQSRQRQQQFREQIRSGPPTSGMRPSRPSLPSRPRPSLPSRPGRPSLPTPPG